MGKYLPWIFGHISSVLGLAHGKQTLNALVGRRSVGHEPPLAASIMAEPWPSSRFHFGVAAGSSDDETIRNQLIFGNQ